LNNVYNVCKKSADFAIKSVFALLHSKLIYLVYENIAQEKGRTFAEVKKVNLSKIPIKSIPKSEQKLFIEMVYTLIAQKKNLFKIHNGILSLLQSKFDIDKLSRKLESWHELTFNEFLKELEKARKKATKDCNTLPIQEQAEWMEYFNQQKAKADELKSQIAQNDSEIDAMVYELYGLTEEEIRVVEEK